MARERMTRQDRYGQLVALAWSLVHELGADELTLGRLAERAGVTKPVVYSHFASRNALLVALFEEYDDRQTAALQRAVDDADATVPARARAIATSYVDCVVGQGPELLGVAAALEGSPELAAFKRRSETAYAGQLTSILASVDGGAVVTTPTMTGVLGAAEALSTAAAAGDMTRDVAVHELATVIETTVERSRLAHRSPR
ncbi:TetR/AcrR family transcriptional regulator [Williamsia deligens]|uniref:TetR/AcrR family transcriptional regulator n=1 Tax=Williamsia deligens TaxID=321325 RepID=A0ABW3GFM5_9NOCA|nr:TetR/AcrR family transcriptional regulator [Williamsia deligens]MCP2195140.1 transcriptional regulator, TetR family [Williamsia deligens]